MSTRGEFNAPWSLPLDISRNAENVGASFAVAKRNANFDRIRRAVTLVASRKDSQGRTFLVQRKSWSRLCDPKDERVDVGESTVPSSGASQSLRYLSNSQHFCLADC